MAGARRGPRGQGGHDTEPLMKTELRNALLIHNPNAGNGGSGRRRILDEARRILSCGGIETEIV